MARLVSQTIVTAVALWITTLLVPGVTVRPFDGSEPLSTILAFLVSALVIGIVNALVGTILKVITVPFYILTLGLWSFIVNAILLWLASFLSDGLGWGLHIDSFWWSAVFGAIVLGLANWAVGGLVGLLGGKS